MGLPPVSQGADDQQRGLGVLQAGFHIDPIGPYVHNLQTLE